MKQVSVVFSFFNESEVIPELVQRLEKAFSKIANNYEYEFIFVNDASTDNSLSLLLELRKQIPQIKILNTSRNFGVTPCTMEGIRHAKGDAVITMDTDLQDPPELIPVLISEWEKGADVVYTVRNSRAGEPRYKMWITNVGYWILRKISSIDLPVQAGDFKLMNRRVVNELVRLNEYSPFLRGLVRWVGFRQVPVLYDREARFAGETHFPVFRWKVVYNFLSGISSFSDMPLYFTFAGGMICGLLAFGYLFAIFYMKYLGWNIPGWSAIMVTILFLGGLQLMALGIIGLYIGMIHMGVKDRPLVILSDKIGYPT